MKTTKRTVTFETMYDSRTCKSREMHVAYKFPKMIALTSSILTSSKREIDRVNQLSEPTTCWHWFVPILVLGLPCLPWVPEAFQARCPVSVSLDPREKPLERSAVPLTFQIDRRLKYFQKLLIVSVFRWLWVVFGGFRSFHILAPTLLEAEIFFGITFWRSLDTRLNWVTKPSDDLFTILYSPPPTGWSAIGWGQGREHFCYLREKKQMGSYLLTLFFLSFSRERILPYLAALRSNTNLLPLAKTRFLREF